MERLPSVEFEATMNPKEAMDAVRARGACAIRNFATIESLQAAAELLRATPMILDENMGGKVPRRQHMNAYVFEGPNTPQPFQELARDVQSFVRKGDFAWEPNEI